MYVGEWYEDLIHGEGKYTYGEGPFLGDSYEGSFIKDLEEGTGKYTFANGDQYIGQWK